MKKVYSTTMLFQAELVRMVLRKHRIASMLHGANVGIRGPATPIEVTVADEHAERALKVIREMRRKKAPKNPAKKRPKARKAARGKPRRRKR